MNELMKEIVKLQVENNLFLRVILQCLTGNETYKEVLEAINKQSEKIKKIIDEN